MRKLLVALLLAAGPVWAAAPNVLSNTDHIVGDVTNAITILGGTLGAGGITVDQTCPSGSTPGVSCLSAGGPSFVSASQMISLATTGGQTVYTAGTATAVDNVPYKVLNQSSTGYTLAGYEQAIYAAATANDLIYEMAYCGTPQTGDYPGVVSSTILPSLSSITQVSVGSSGCGYQTGIEFSMVPGYKGFDTASPSGSTEAMSGVMAMMRSNHSTWTWGDIKGALRQTTDAWSSGYAAKHTSPALSFGYGNINYDSAVAISSTNSIYLQPPGFVVQNHIYYVTATLYPYMSTRRSKEVVYIGGSWPAASSVNEMTAAQITAAGGTKIFDNAGATGVQTFTYAPAATGSATLTAITLDASGNGSRVESFTQSAQSFVVGTACLQ